MGSSTGARLLAHALLILPVALSTSSNASSTFDKSSSDVVTVPTRPRLAFERGAGGELRIRASEPAHANPPMLYRFAFGDGEVAGPQSSSVASHAYSPGAWTVTVTAIDGRGATVKTSAVVSVPPATLKPVMMLKVLAPYAPGLRPMPTDPARVFTELGTPIPSHLSSFTEPTFGTTVTRVTGVTGTALTTSLGPGTWSIDARHHYVKDEPWNSDETLISIDNEGGSPTRLYLDGETYKVRREQCWEHRHGDDRWNPSPLHPHERISCSGDELAWIDVVKCVKTRTWPLPFWVHGIGETEGNPSADGRYVALEDGAKVFVVDMDPQPPYAPYPNSRMGPVFNLGGCGLTDCSIDWVSISPSGKYVVIKYTGEHMRVLDVNPSTLALTPRPMPATSPRCFGTADQGYVYDLGHLDMARNPFDHDEDVMVGQDHCNNIGRKLNGQLMGGVVMVRLKDDLVTSLTDPTNEAYPAHVSCRNLQRPGWAYVSYFYQPGMRFSDELIAVKMDGSKAVERFAHTHTNFDNCYRCEAHGVPSPDGRRVLWASNWTRNCTICGSSSDKKAYIADARALAPAGAPALAPYVALADATGSVGTDGTVKSYSFDFGDGVTAGPQSASQAPHTYAAGTWNLRATITDNSGNSSTASLVVAVTDTSRRPPVADLVVTPASGVAPLQVVADASASHDDGRIYQYRFDFGDGTTVTSTTPIVQHTYQLGGWRPSVIVTDLTSLADTASTTVLASRAASDSAGINLVGNPSFESDLSGWAAYGSATLSRNTGGQDQRYCVHAGGPITYGVFGINDSPNWVGKNAHAGARYRVSAWVRSTLIAGRCRLQLREWLNGVQQGGTAYSPYVRLNAGWQQVSADILMLTAGSSLDVQVLDEPALGGEGFDIDNVSIRPVSSDVTLDDVGGTDLSPLAPRVMPNPVFGRAHLDFVLSQDGPLRVDLFDPTGRKVRVLADEPFALAGPHQLPIDGRDQRGLRLPAGLYFYRVVSGAVQARGRFVITR